MPDTKNFYVKKLAHVAKSQVRRYRRIRRGGKLLNIAFLKGGKSVATSEWTPKG